MSHVGARTAATLVTPRPSSIFGVLTAARREALVLGALAAFAMALRFVAFLHWTDSTGDGPTHAIVAYDWARAPFIQGPSTLGDWLPGYKILTGLFNIVVPDPWISTRLLNVILGTAMIPVFYVFVRTIYGATLAFFSTAVLTVLPLHAALSATSLSEVSTSLEIVAGTLLLIMAAEGRGRRSLALVLSGASLTLALMTRWEMWALIPLFPAYYFFKTHDGRTAGAFAAALLLLPAVCLITAYRGNSDLVHSASASISDSWGLPVLQASDGLRAVKIAGRKAIDHLGLALALAIVAGGVLQIANAVRGKITAAPALHLSMALIPVPLLLYIAATRGPYGWDRYLLFGLVIGLPFALIPFKRSLETQRPLLGILTLIAFVSVGVASLPLIRDAETGYGSPLYITRKEPTEIKNLSRWLAQSPYRDEAILMTLMDGAGYYLPLYFPARKALFVMESVTSDAELQRFVARRHPALFVTGAGDEADRARVETLFKTRLGKLVHTEGRLHVYLFNMR